MVLVACTPSILPHCSVQWGKTYTVAGSLFVAFPVQFANSAYSIVCTEADAGMWQPTQAVLSGIASGVTITGFTAHSRWINDGVVATSGETISYIAIGR